MLLAVCLLLLGIVSGVEGSKDEVAAIGDEYFEFRMKENPGVAGRHGIAKYQDEVEEWNYPAFNRRVRKSREMLTRVKTLLENKDVDHTDKVGLKIIEFTLEKFIEGSAFMNYTVTLNQGLAFLANNLMLRPITTMEQLGHWYHRVIGYQSVFEDQIELLTIGINSGLTPTKMAAERCLSAYRKALGADVIQFFAFKPWSDLNVAASNRSFYDMGREECTKLRTVMMTFVDKLERDYIPACRDINHISTSSLPGGSEFYAATLKYYTSSDMTPEKAHQIGLDEMQRIRTEMEKIVEREGFKGTIREFVKTLYSDSNEYFPTREALLAGYKDMLNDKVRPKMDREFYPEPAIGVNMVDDPFGGLGRYSSPKWNGTAYSDGIFLYDGSKPTELLKINMLPILVHETLPGHHYQLAYVLLTSLPDFRKYSTGTAYEQGAFNFPSFGSYIEGWGLYSEYVSEVMGIIATDREMLGRLSLEGLRAARLVVDTGLHYYNWTFNRTVDYLENNTLLSRGQCEEQIRRYVRWPGQACAYKIGEIKIKEIRQKAITTLGDDFNVKDFHKAILDLGACPLEIMEDEMNRWINAQPTTSTAVSISIKEKITLAMMAILYLIG